MNDELKRAQNREAECSQCPDQHYDQTQSAQEREHQAVQELPPKNETDPSASAIWPRLMKKTRSAKLANSS